MPNPDMEIGVCVNTRKEQTHMLMFIIYLQRELRKSKLIKLDKYPEDPDKMTNLARQTLAGYENLIKKNRR